MVSEALIEIKRGREDCADLREGCALAVIEVVLADLALALLPTVLEHDPAGAACRGDVHDITIGAELLPVVLREGSVEIHAPEWVGATDALVVLPCPET